MLKKRIVILHYTAPPIVGGVENVIATHIKLLRNKGYSITLVAGRGSTGLALEGVDTCIIPELDSQSPLNQVVAEALAHETVPPEFQQLTDLIQEQLLPVLSRADVTIVHNAFNFHFNLPLTAALHQMLDQHQIRQLIAWCHDISRHVNPASGFEQKYGWPWDLLRVYRPEVKYIAVSHARQRTLAGLFDRCREEIRVIPNGVNLVSLLGLGHVSSGLAREFQLFNADLVLLMPVRITRAKNMEYALRVTARLRDQGLRIRLIVTGPPDPHASDGHEYFESLLEMRRNLSLSQEVVFIYQGSERLGYPLLLSQEMVAELYRICDIVFMPSLREGFGLPVLEAGLIGKPVFSTRIPVLEEVPDESVYEIATDEPPEKVASRIIMWMQGNPVYQLRASVRRRYTWERILEQEIEPLLAECEKEVRIQGENSH